VIREVRDADMAALRRLHYELFPGLLAGTADGFRHWVSSQPVRARFRGIVDEEQGELVGWAEVGLDWQTSVEGASQVWVAVEPAHRRRGIGSGLGRVVDEHLVAIGARHAETFAVEGSEGQAWAERHGYALARREICSVVDPRSIDLAELQALEAEKAAEGFRVAPLAELRANPQSLHALDAAVTVDVPVEFPVDDVRYDEWLAGTYAAPDLDWEASRVVFAGDRPVAFTMLNVDPEVRLAENDMTGTLAEFRGRGLARLAKLSALAAAAELGIERVSTGNDAENQGMLAVNRRLGYRRQVVLAWLTKELG
jgi:GNAT superfamily N-acetyltransferase